jgi:subfamily B ATP-binding cassette protein MsbA
MIYEILDISRASATRPDAGRLPWSTRARSTLRHVSFAYGDNRAILKGVSFTAEGGKTTAIVGPSGAGKSTLISAAAALLRSEPGGAILIDGQDIAM